MNAPPALPYSEDSERALLCSMILDADVLASCSGLSFGVFYLPKHQIVFRALSEFHATDRPIDFVPIKNHLDAAGQLEDVGGMVGLNEIWSFVPSGANWRYYLDIVSDRHQRRVTILSCQKISASMHDVLTERTGSVREEAEQALAKLAIDTVKQEKTFREQILDTLDELETLSETVCKKGAIFGIKSLDDAISGMLPKEVWVIAAESSQGKSALAMQAALYSSMQRGLYTLVFSLEMGASELIKRMLSHEGSVSMRHMRDGLFPKSDLDKLHAAVDKLATAKMHIYDDFNLNWNSIASYCRQKQTELSKAGDKLGLVIMDYLQLIESSATEERKELEISANVQASKSLAKELGCPVVAVSQLNEQGKLYGARSIKHHADGLLLILKNEKSNESGMIDIAVAKMRNGPRDVLFPTRFYGEFMTFEDRPEKTAGREY